MALERKNLTAGNMIRGVVRALADVFTPIIPAIVASGLLMGLIEGIDHAMAGALQMNHWWILLHTFASASFVFLQILIGFSAARAFGGNEFLGGVIGMVMNHTSLMNAWDIPVAIHRFGQNAFQIVGSRGAARWLSVIADEELGMADATSQAIMNAGGVPQVDLVHNHIVVTLQGYQGHILSVVLAVFVMCQLERWFHAHVPDMLDLFVTPLATVLLTSLAMMIVIGPFFSLLEEFTLSFFKFLLSIPFGVGCALAGAIYPLTVVMGVHHLFNAYEASLCALTPPYNYFNTIVSAASVAQGGACLAVFFKSRSVRRKGLSLPAGIAAVLGVAEPAIYGLNLPSVRPFVAAMLGASVGGALVSVLDAYATSMGISGIFGYLIAADSTNYLMVLGASFAVSFGTALLLYQEAPQVEEIVEDATDEESAETAEPVVEADDATAEAVEEAVPVAAEPTLEEALEEAASVEAKPALEEAAVEASQPMEEPAIPKRSARRRRRPNRTRRGIKVTRRALPRNTRNRRRGVRRAMRRR